MTAGVLVLHPWWGLNDDVRAYAERLRREGYQVATLSCRSRLPSGMRLCYHRPA